MNLTESQLFTIEALNRIEGFEWPEWAETAAMDAGSHAVCICKDTPCRIGSYFESEYSAKMQSCGVTHPDWRNSLITREQFESVGGWVRNTKLKLPPELLDSQIEVLHHNGEIAFDDANSFYWDENVDKWRYHKPQKENMMPEQVDEQQSIEQLYDEYQTARSSLLDMKNQVEYLQGVVDASLAKIKSWHKERGFDVSEVKPEINPIVKVDVKLEPELKITDWRDLQKGDVIWWSGDISNKAGEYNVLMIEGSLFEGDMPINVMSGGSDSWVNVKGEQWKFIRRP